MRATLASLWLLSALGTTAAVRADAEFIFVSVDAPGQGLRDNTPTAPVGGNNGATLGQQRQLALEYTGRVWGQLLDSEVPIRVQVNFEPLGCTPAGMPLAQARPWDYFGNFPGATVPDTWYASSLADRLSRADVDPGSYDISTQINSEVDDPGCNGGVGWYLGFDHSEGNSFDLVAVMLHELGHGLGSAGLTNLVSGTMPMDAPSMYERLTYDLGSGQYWDEMNNAQRVVSATHVRQVVWDGVAVKAAATQILALGMGTLDIVPSIADFTGGVGTADFGPQLAAPPLVGVLQLGNDAAGDTADGCEPLASLTGRIALLDRGTCLFITKVENAQDAGAIGVVIADNVAGGPPVGMTGMGDTSHIRVPSVRITLADGDLLKAAMGQQQRSAGLGIDAARRAGTAPGGEVYLFAADPVQLGSSISHWDPVASPNLLMEPSITSQLTDDVDLTLPLLRDVGWRPFECGNGDHEPGEQCDAGDQNSDGVADRCRLDCRSPYCGDGVSDTGEQCDDGNNTSGDGCSLGCIVEFCGDGVVNDMPNEVCDSGANNSDSTPNACRTNCQLPRCGDAVTDSGEDCDDGGNNSDITPNACRAGCIAPSCGDAVIDDGEVCDNGGNNSDFVANACRRACVAPRCGDGVADDGEDCDDGVDNSDAPDACRATCDAPACGDGIVDGGEACDDGDGNRDDAPDSCRTNCALPGCGDGLLDVGEVCDDGNTATGDGCDASCAPEPEDGGDGDGDGDGDAGDGDGDSVNGADGSQGGTGGEGDVQPAPSSSDCRCSTPGRSTTGGLPMGSGVLGAALIGLRARRRLR